ncbi:MAG: hypothetical protein ACI3YB_00115 [Prevotella sp.]
MKTTIKRVSNVLKVSEGQISAEQREQGLRHMEEAFVRLLDHSDKDNLYWIGSQTDLVEMVYEVYAHGRVRDASGEPLSLHRLVLRTCALLHMYVPTNIYQVASRARRRKGVKSHTFIERYAWQRYVNGVDNPLTCEIKKMGDDQPSLQPHN